MANDCLRGPNLVETKTLAARIPGEGPEKGVQLLRGIPEPREILAQDDDYIRTESFRFRDQLELVEALKWRLAGLHKPARG